MRSSLFFIGRDWYPWDVAPKKKEGRRGGAKKVGASPFLPLFL